MIKNKKLKLTEYIQIYKNNDPLLTNKQFLNMLMLWYEWGLKVP